MQRIVGASLLSLITIGFPAMGYGQQPATPKGAVGPGPGAGGAAAGMPGGTDVLATVTSHNQTDKITKAEVAGLLSRYGMPAPDERELMYNRAVEILVNFHLLQHYLSVQPIPVPDAKIDEQIDRMKDQLKKEGQELATFFYQNGTSMDEVRKQMAKEIRWAEFSKQRATDGTLRKFLNDNRDRFSRTQVRASHILLKTEPSTSDADKQKIKQKLLSIRNEIVQNKISFAAAANKYSEDPANAGGAGGDLDYFTLDSGFVDEFAHAAFKLKKGEVSEPVETPYGYHLIQITDRKEGRLPDFEQNKPYLFQEYKVELQKGVVDEERKTAKIETKPMPKDFYPPEATAAPNTPSAAQGAGGTAAPKP
jgi:peptidyl-prolyl cis-trans isomerase C